MSTRNQLSAQQQKINRLELTLAKEKQLARKADARRKIELGGLVIKAKMDAYSKAVILGALMSALESIEREEGMQAIYQQKGELEFLNQ